MEVRHIAAPNNKLLVADVNEVEFISRGGVQLENKLDLLFCVIQIPLSSYVFPGADSTEGSGPTVSKVGRGRFENCAMLKQQVRNFGVCRA